MTISTQNIFEKVFNRYQRKHPEIRLFWTCCNNCSGTTTVFWYFLMSNHGLWGRQGKGSAWLWPVSSSIREDVWWAGRRLVCWVVCYVLWRKAWSRQCCGPHIMNLRKGLGLHLMPLGSAPLCARSFSFSNDHIQTRSLSSKDILGEWEPGSPLLWLGCQERVWTLAKICLLKPFLSKDRPDKNLFMGFAQSPFLDCRAWEICTEFSSSQPPALWFM